MIATGQINHDIRNILFVLLASVICAGLLAFGFLHYYGPSGRYLAGHTLLDPSIIKQIDYQDRYSQTEKKVRFTFDHIEFFYFNSQKGQIHVPFVSLDVYQKFYKMVAFEKSLEEVTNHVRDLFLQSHPSFLIINMHTKEESQSKVFQIVQIIEEDYFRVQLHESKEGEWAYFYRPGLYQDSIRLLTTYSENL